MAADSSSASRFTSTHWGAYRPVVTDGRLTAMEPAPWDGDPSPIGSLDKHGNPNVLTPDIGNSSLAQGCAAQSARVEIERWENSLPAITAFEPPVFARQV